MQWSGGKRHKDGLNIGKDVAYSSKRERNMFEMQTKIF